MAITTAAAKKPHPERALQSVEVVSVVLGGGAAGMVVDVDSEDVVTLLELENPLELVEVERVLVPKDELDE